MRATPLKAHDAGGCGKQVTGAAADGTMTIILSNLVVPINFVNRDSLILNRFFSFSYHDSYF
jgi:hypothetical protein